MRHKIEWLNRPGTTGATWNPISGCTKISPGCKNCYAERMSKRLRGRAGYPADDPFRVIGHPGKLDAPYRWRKPRTVFVCSMGDLFHEDVPWPDIERIFQVMLNYKNRHHTFMLLTKRAKRMHEFITANYPGLDRCAPHIWGLITAENQEQADKRIPWLLKTPFAVRGVSVEPMLGPVDISEYIGENAYDWWSERGPLYPGDMIPLHWIICGAETGPGARPMDLAWLRSIRDQCAVTGTPFFFKRTSPGTETPPDLAIREWPEV